MKLQNKETLERSKSTSTAGYMHSSSLNKNINVQYENYSPDVIKKAKSGKVSNLISSNQTINTHLIKSNQKKSERNLAHMKQGDLKKGFKANEKFREEIDGCGFKWGFIVGLD